VELGVSEGKDFGCKGVVICVFNLVRTCQQRYEREEKGEGCVKKLEMGNWNAPSGTHTCLAASQSSRNWSACTFSGGESW
jgi:hypothetical protein